MAATNLTEFLAQMTRSGLQKSNNFEMIIPLPTALLGTFNLTKITLSAFSATIPSYNIATEDSYVEIDSRRKIVNDYDKGEITVQFYVDSNNDTLSLFNSWREAIINNKIGAVKFHETYVSSNVQLLLYKNDGEVASTYVFDEVFPKTIDTMNVDWSTTNQVLVLSVTFVYRKFYYYQGLRLAPFENKEMTDANTNSNKVDQLASTSVNRPVDDAAFGNFFAGLSTAVALKKEFGDNLGLGISAASLSLSSLADLGNEINSESGDPEDPVSFIQEIKNKGSEVLGSLKDSFSSTGKAFKDNFLDNDFIKSTGEVYDEIAARMPTFEELGDTAESLSAISGDLYINALDLQNAINSVVPGAANFTKDLEKLRGVKEVSDNFGNAFENLGKATSKVEEGQPARTVKEDIRSTAAGVKSATTALKKLKNII